MPNRYQLGAYGLKFVTPDKVVVFSGDTCPVPLLAMGFVSAELRIQSTPSDLQRIINVTH
ncbi:MAG: hypothetical protein ACPGWR_21200 [Ardenticatenaceae bacterium]